MAELNQTQPQAQKKSYTAVWIIVGLLALCGCAALAGVIGSAVAGYLTFQQRAVQAVRIGVSPAPTLPPAAVPKSGGGAGVVIDVPIESREHVPEGSPITYNSDPPAGGKHYATPLGPGFYTKPELDGYIVHSMEHGYVVIWYDCSSLRKAACDELQKQIQNLISNTKIKKLIGMPRNGMGHTIALTSWGKLAFLDNFDKTFITQFINEHINQAPENVP